MLCWKSASISRTYVLVAAISLPDTVWQVPMIGILTPRTGSLLSESQQSRPALSHPSADDDKLVVTASYPINSAWHFGVDRVSALNRDLPALPSRLILSTAVWSVIVLADYPRVRLALLAPDPQNLAGCTRIVAKLEQAPGIALANLAAVATATERARHWRQIPAIMDVRHTTTSSAPEVTPALHHSVRRPLYFEYATFQSNDDPRLKLAIYLER